MRAITPPLLPSALRPSFLLDNSQASDEVRSSNELRQTVKLRSTTRKRITTSSAF